MMRVKPLLHLARQRMSVRRRKVWVFAGLMAGALVPMLVVQSQAAAYNVFCVGASWKSPEEGKTMEELDFPKEIPSDIRSVWPSGLPSSDKESTAAGVTESDKVTYRLYPDPKQKFLCAGTSAAPCVVSDTVTITYETWQSQHWNISSTITGSWAAPGVTGGLGGSISVTAGYGKEWGNRETKSSAVTNMVPYKLNDVVEPAHFIEWRERKGGVKGAYFNTGAVCRTDGEEGEQYEWRDDLTHLRFTFERNIGEGNLWMKETSPTEFQQDYNGQDGAPKIPDK